MLHMHVYSLMSEMLRNAYFLIIHILPMLECITIRDEYFSWTGKFPTEYDLGFIGEFLLKDARNAGISCGILCVSDLHCKHMEICGPDEMLCRLWETLPTPGNTSQSSCNRYSMMHVCLEWEYFNRIQNKCMSGSAESSANSLVVTTYTSSAVDTTLSTVESTSISTCTACECMQNQSPGESLYNIKIGGKSHGALCYFDIHAWIVIQNRLDGTFSFIRDWINYDNGFGSLTTEFWLGNKYIHNLTSEGLTFLRIEMMDYSGSERYAEYSNFSLEDKDHDYRLHVGGYSGNAGDSLIYHDNMKFSTYDREYDIWHDNCAQRFFGGWWYRECLHSNLNGDYGNTDNSEGINWKSWKGLEYSLKTTRMMIRKP